MLNNYLKIAFRSLLKSKIHSTINIMGLGLGVACCVLIVLFVKDEWSFDTFHSKADRIYRAWVLENYGPDEQYMNTNTPLPLGNTLKENFQEVEAFTQVTPIAAQVRVDENTFSETITVVGSDFFQIFDFKVIKGNKKALEDLTQVAVTQQVAEKYFGSLDPINKTIAIQLGEDYEDFVIKAVVENPPGNSSVQFDILLSDLNNVKLYSEQNLNSGWFNVIPETYILLEGKEQVIALTSKFEPLFKSILGEDFEGEYKVGLQPLLDIHLNTEFPVAYAPVNNPRYSYILVAVASLILVVACINFITLSVGKSSKRAKEVGVRKVVGAQRKHLVFQFIGEAVIVTVLALTVGFVQAYLSMPLFNELAGKNLDLNPDLFMIGVGLSLIFVIGLFAGSYPAFVLSSFRPIAILKGKVSVGSTKQNLRKSLVAVQLVLSIFLISSTLVMREQLAFLQNKDMGFNKEQLIVVPINVQAGLPFMQRIDAGFERLESLKYEIKNVPGVARVFSASQDFGNGNWIQVGFTDSKDLYREFNLNVVDADFIPGMDMQMIKGRNFSLDNPSDKRRSIIVNEAFVKEYGFTNPIGERIPGNRFEDHEVIGVVKDFNYNSLYTEVEPLVIVMNIGVVRAGIESIGMTSSVVPKLMVRIQPGNMQNTIDAIKEKWTLLTGGEEFNFAFVDETMAAQYRADQNLGKIISIATMLAILIGSLGLYALASLAMQNRTKEISIRKVLGATEKSLLVLLSKDYIILIGISLLVSVPFTLYTMNVWLESFEYRIAIGWDSFAFAGAISLLVAVLTISYNTIKAAWAQPAEALKYE
ncbi:MAG: FtsX-like permease family protein [Cyclobacteriaceae bacterium]